MKFFSRSIWSWNPLEKTVQNGQLYHLAQMVKLDLKMSRLKELRLCCRYIHVLKLFRLKRIKIPTNITWFPWAARMNPQSRNLHRVTVPEYMEDGTSEITIMVCKIKTNMQQVSLLVAQSPSGGLVYSVLNRLQGRKCEILVKKIGDFSYIFHIPDETIKKWILTRGL